MIIIWRRDGTHSVYFILRSFAGEGTLCRRDHDHLVPLSPLAPLLKIQFSRFYENVRKTISAQGLSPWRGWAPPNDWNGSFWACAHLRLAAYQSFNDINSPCLPIVLLILPSFSSSYRMISSSNCFIPICWRSKPRVILPWLASSHRIFWWGLIFARTFLS